MSRSSTATASKIPPQLPVKSAWAKGPPNSAVPSSPRSQSPAPTNPSNATHSRRPSTLSQSQGVPIKDGVSVPRNNVGAVKQGSAVTFGSIDDVSAPISSSPAATPAIKSEGVKSFGSVAATPAPQANGKAATVSASSSKPSQTPSTATSSTVSTPSKPAKMDIRKLFQGPSASSSSTPPSDTSSPSTRTSSLPQQQQPSQSTQLGNGPYTPFVPGMRPPQQQQNGQRSPMSYRQNGSGSRPPNGPNGQQPQISPGLGSPRLAHQHPGPPTVNMAPPPPQPMAWPGYYYPEQYGMYPPGQWYVPQPPMPQHHQQPHHMQHPPPTPGQPGGPPLPGGMPMSPRNNPMSLQQQGPPPNTTPIHSVVSLPGTNISPSHQQQPQHGHAPPMTPHSHTHSGSIMSPPPTPSSTTARLNTNANAFVPGGRPTSKVTIKSIDGTEVNLENLKKQSPVPHVPSVPLPPQSPAGGGGSRKSFIRIESEDSRKKRLLEEQQALKAKAEAEDKAKKEKEDKEKAEKDKVLEEEERKKKEKEEKEKERIRKEEEEKERIRLEDERVKKEAEEAERIRQAELKKKEEEEKERIRLAEEEEKEKQRLKEEEEKLRIQKEEEEKAAAVKTEAAVDVPVADSSDKVEDGEVEEAQPVPEAATEEVEEVTEVKESSPKPKTSEKENLRVDTAAPAPTDKKRPGRLDLSYTSSTNIPQALPSALATARHIDDLGRVPYPEGIKSPQVELNVNAKDGKFRYDRDFLLQFMAICREKPDMLPPLDAIGLEPVEQQNPMTRGGSGRHRQGSGASTPISRQASGVGLGFVTPASGFGKPGAVNPFNMGSFAMGNTTKMSSEDRFNVSSGRIPSGSGASGGMPFGRPPQMQRTASNGPGMPSNRTRSKRGEKRNEGNKVGGGGGQQHGGYGNTHSGSMAQGGMDFNPAPLTKSTNGWDRKTVGAVDPDSPEMVDRKVKGLLNKLTMEKFDSISDQIITWANKSEKEKDGRTLIQVIRLVFEKATDEATWSEMYARLCRKMMEQISSKVQDDGIKNAEQKPIAGGQLFRKYLLNRCQEDFERGWVAKEATAAAAATKAMEDQAAKASNEKSKEQDTGDEIVLYSDEYYAAQKAKRQGLGLIKFIGELFKLQMLTERIMHECIKKLLGNVENPEEEEIESLCKLLTTVGAILDTSKARAHMDVYFSRMKELTKSTNVSSRMQFMLQDVIELRERRWATRNVVSAPTTIAQIHEAAAKEKAASDKESYQRQMSMSRGGSRRGGDRGGDYQQVGPDGWTVASGSGPPRPPAKAGDLSNFGKINKAAPMTFGPSSIFTSKKEGKRESISRVSSNSNMFSMLSANPEAVDAALTKTSRAPSRKASIDLGQAGIPEAPAQRKRLVLKPRSVPVEGDAAAAPSEVPSEAEQDDEEEEGEVAADEMSEDDAVRKITEDVKEFFGVRNLDEAEHYFDNLPAPHHFRLIDKLVAKAVESKPADVQLVSDFLAVIVSKNLCSSAALEEGFMPTAEILDDLAIDAPRAFSHMATMMKAAGLDEEQRNRIASKLMDSATLLSLIS